ncbi:protein of unknown function [Magnetospirillum gryphiswaldense MSR-1 v2]|uniref:Uncharacterized protein n=1 Tax=Magnetospirillum gryphiswaldense (strain DSM 6361 / JCM 21280 / NBRC 15271 / MSR-1) TaxID=431944 RepID=V6F287_MAGGM|nr:protein of unknown function [Magnetospirillum gryphiswaldense MSR-1 v2]
MVRGRRQAELEPDEPDLGPDTLNYNETAEDVAASKRARSSDRTIILTVCAMPTESHGSDPL